jgi:hypothetical protein
MASESRLPRVIFAVIVLIIAIPFVVDEIRDRRRPVLVEVRIVTATSSDPVYRDGRRLVPAGDRVEIALAMRVQRWGSEDTWISPAPRLELEGTPTPHFQSSVWPDDSRTLRAFWFSVECQNLGGMLTAETAGERLRYRTFLAPEMGRGLQAEGLPESHNDDHIGETGSGSREGPGTVRLYARVEVAEEAGDVRPLQAQATMDADKFLDPAFPTILIAAEFGDNIEPSAGELFRLPGFEPQGETPAERNAVPEQAFGRTFSQLVSDRIVVSSWTLAASAVGAEPNLDPSRLENLGVVEIGDGRVSSGRRILLWGTDVAPGDLLADGEHWMVLLGDNGDGVLDPSDGVLHSWGRPPVRTTLFSAVVSGSASLEHRRLGR